MNGTVQSIYNIPHYSTDLDITQSWCVAPKYFKNGIS